MMITARRLKTKSYVKILFLLLISFAFVIQGCVRPGSREPIEIVYTGFIIGTVGPCHCPSAQLGGLPRRATMLERTSGNSANRLMLDAGNFSSVDPSIGRARTEILLSGLGRLGLRAVSPGYRDMRHGLDFLLEIQEKYNTPFISSNIIIAGTERHPFPGHKLIRVGAQGMNSGVLVGVIGVMKNHPSQSIPEIFGIEMEDAKLALRRELNRLPDNVDVIVLMTDADRSEVTNWLEDMEPGTIDIVISSSRERGSSNRGVALQQTLFYNGSRQGKVLHRLLLEKGSGTHWNITRVTIPLDEDVASDPEMMEFIEESSEELGFRFRDIF